MSAEELLTEKSFPDSAKQPLTSVNAGVNYKGMSKTAKGSETVILGALAARLSAVENDPVKTKELLDSLRASRAALQRAVVLNTPAVTVRPRGAWKTTAEAGKILGVKSSRIRQLCIAGHLKAVKLGRDWLIDAESLKNYKLPRRGRKAKK